MNAWTLRELAAGEDDRRFLTAMLYEAATWRPGPRELPGAVLARSEIARYAAGWGREGDFGLVAVSLMGERLGAAWYRLFDPAEPGYGFVGAEIPELSVAVRPSWRGRGIGTALVGGLIDQATAQGRPGLSLGVEDDNPARLLYRKLGFRKVGAAEDTHVLLLELGPRTEGDH
jgi:ribosomal protein S18 acetylase RimI-like enzyme